MTSIPTIVDQHAEEGALLWLLRDEAVRQPHYLLDDLAQLDGRIDAHLDGLMVADKDSSGVWQTCLRELEWGEEGEVFVAAMVALKSGRQERIETAIAAASTSYKHSRPLISALSWLEHHTFVEECLLADDAFRNRIGIAAAANLRRDPGDILRATILTEDYHLKRRSLRAAGELCRGDLIPILKDQLCSVETCLHASAAWSLTVMAEDDAAIRCLQRVVEQDEQEAILAIHLVPRCLELTAAVGWIRELSSEPTTVRHAIIGAGILGEPTLAPWLIEAMESPSLARVAGEAFTMITGLDLSDPAFEGECPPGFEVGPKEDPEDESVEMDVDENLQWPNVEAVAKWWGKNRDQYAKGARYLIGRPLDQRWCKSVMHDGFQRQRASAAIEIAVRNPGAGLFEVRARGIRQKRLLHSSSC